MTEGIRDVGSVGRCDHNAHPLRVMSALFDAHLLQVDSDTHAKFDSLQQ